MTKLPLIKRKTKITPADVLDRAADLLEERGWTRYTLESDTGCLCAVGAINVAWFGKPRGSVVSGVWECGSIQEQAISALVTEVSPYAIEPRYGVMDWNDEFAKNKRQVVATMRRVAKKLRAA